MRLACMISLAHVMRYVSEWCYWNYCGGFIQSIFASGSFTCRGLRWASETANAQMVTYVGTDLLKALEH